MYDVSKVLQRRCWYVSQKLKFRYLLHADSLRISSLKQYTFIYIKYLRKNVSDGLSRRKQRNRSCVSTTNHT